MEEEEETSVLHSPDLRSFLLCHRTPGFFCALSPQPWFLDPTCFLWGTVPVLTSQE